MSSATGQQKPAGAKKRILYRCLGTDDAQSTDAFLEALVVNATVTKRSYPSVVWSSLPINQQLSTVTLVSTASYLVTQGAVPAWQLICIQVLLALVGAALAALCQLASRQSSARRHSMGLKGGPADSQPAVPFVHQGGSGGRRSVQGGGIFTRGKVHDWHCVPPAAPQETNAAARRMLPAARQRSSTAEAGVPPDTRDGSSAPKAAMHPGPVHRSPAAQDAMPPCNLPLRSSSAINGSASPSVACLPKEEQTAHANSGTMTPSLGEATAATAAVRCQMHPCTAARPAAGVATQQQAGGVLEGAQREGCERRRGGAVTEAVHGEATSVVHASAGGYAQQQEGQRARSRLRLQTAPDASHNAKQQACNWLQCCVSPPTGTPYSPSPNRFPSGSARPLALPACSRCCAPISPITSWWAREALPRGLLAAALVGMAALLSPLYATLAQSISTDTIILLCVLLLAAHLFLWDYGFEGRVSGRAVRLSLGCAILAAILGASRGGTALGAFAQVSLALEAYVLFPQLRHRLQRAWPWASPCLALLLQAVAVRLLLPCSILLATSSVCAGVFVCVICPMWLVRLGKFKAQINGPWDEAVPKLSRNVSLRMSSPRKVCVPR